jgi:outer membrane immunogenic protein
MRKFSLTLLAAAIGLAASQASAADLPRKAPAYIPPAPPLITWTGCYIGANIGGAFGNASVTGNGGSGGEVSTNGSGFAGGGQIGCDYQFAGTGWVIGFRDMFDGTSNKRSGTLPTSVPGIGGDVVNFNNQWFNTLTGRLGYAVAPTWLLYFQGGGAWAHTSTNITSGGVQIGQTSNTRSGWTIGGGVEWMFAPHWSAFLEGNYMDFGTRNGTVFGVAACAGGCAYAAKATETTVLVGVNYRFW